MNRRPSDDDRKLLNLVQKEIELIARPFERVAAELGTSEEDVLERLRQWRDEEGVIRQISAIFDTRKLGYRSTLVAMKVAPEGVDEAARLINEHPGVSHNYERAHEFNIWFTIATPPGMDLEEHIDRLHQLCGAEATRILPTLKMFKIEVRLDMEEGVSNADGPPPPKVEIPPLTDDAVRAIRALQVDMPLVPRPFAEEAATVGMDEDELLRHAHTFLADGRMRRCAAILAHRRAGFLANGMGVWKMPEEQAVELGYRIASFPQVTHCYQRPVYEDWPYRVFSMVHARDEDKVREVISKISGETGLDEYDILFSTREFKKTRVPYFTGEYEAWADRYLNPSPV
ncbi:MAG: Lrp/AsnC family transcriptional regulator [Candidatus Binatia bacterium]